MKKTPTVALWALCGMLSMLFGMGGRLYSQSIIGGTDGDPSAVLELRSSSQGLLLPRLSSAERTAMVDPAKGLMIYNTTLGCLEINLGSSGSPDWVCLLAMTGQVASLDCAGVQYTGNFIAGIPTAGLGTLAYTGGDGQFYNSQMISSTGVTGLTATLAAGTFAVGNGSLAYTITGTPSEAGTASFDVQIGGQSCTFELVVSALSCGAYVANGVWKEFMCHNLGANVNADPFVPSWELNGHYYQWGRNPDCFGRDGIDDTNPCSSPVYGAAAPWGNTSANDNSGSIAGWNTVGAPNGAWADGNKTINDPCPAGYRVPTASQWSGVIDEALNQRTLVGTWTMGETNYDSGFMFGPSLYLPATGVRTLSDGSLILRAGVGSYWSSTESVSDVLVLYFLNDSEDSDAYLVDGGRLYGLPLRCVKQ